MRASRTLGWFPLSLALCLSAGACDMNAPNYVAPKNAVEVGVGMPASGSGTEKLTLQFRSPTQAERKILNDMRQQKGFPVPWLRRQDLPLSVQYTITNLSDQPGVAQVKVDGANEYTSYDPSAILAAFAAANPGVDEEDQPFVPSLIEMTPVMIPAKGSVTGNIREDDFDEAALDLDALGSWMGPYLSVLLHKSQQSPIGLEMVPKNVDVPQLYQVYMTLLANQHMKLEFVVRVRDDRGILAADGDPLFNPNPTVYAIPAAMMMP